MPAHEVFNIMIVGVGGQGVLTIAQLLREYAIHHLGAYGLASMESRGVSQREGSVYATVRFLHGGLASESVFPLSPVTPIQGVDLILALEPMEFLRNLHFLKPNGAAIVNTRPIIPKSALLKSMKTQPNHGYPNISESLKKVTKIWPEMRIQCQDFVDLASKASKKPFYANYLALERIPTLVPFVFDAATFKTFLANYY